MIKNESTWKPGLGRETNRLLKQMWHEWNTIWLNYRARTIGQETKQWYSYTKITLSTNGSTSNLENEKLHRISLAGYSNVQRTPGNRIPTKETVEIRFPVADLVGGDGRIGSYDT